MGGARYKCDQPLLSDGHVILSEVCVKPFGLVQGRAYCAACTSQTSESITWLVWHGIILQITWSAFTEGKVYDILVSSSILPMITPGELQAGLPLMVAAPIWTDGQAPMLGARVNVCDVCKVYAQKLRLAAVRSLYWRGRGEGLKYVNFSIFVYIHSYWLYETTLAFCPCKVR